MVNYSRGYLQPLTKIPISYGLINNHSTEQGLEAHICCTTTPLTIDEPPRAQIINEIEAPFHLLRIVLNCECLTRSINTNVLLHSLR